VACGCVSAGSARLEHRVGQQGVALCSSTERPAAITRLRYVTEIPSARPVTEPALRRPRLSRPYPGGRLCRRRLLRVTNNASISQLLVDAAAVELTLSSPEPVRGQAAFSTAGASRLLALSSAGRAPTHAASTFGCVT